MTLIDLEAELNFIQEFGGILLVIELIISRFRHTSYYLIGYSPYPSLSCIKSSDTINKQFNTDSFLN